MLLDLLQLYYIFFVYSFYRILFFPSVDKKLNLSIYYRISEAWMHYYFLIFWLK